VIPDVLIDKQGTILLTSSKRDVIVIGASLGGMEALKVLFSCLPQDLAASILVVWHMPAQAENLLPNILNRVTPLKVTVAKDGEAIKPGCAYIAQPNFHLVVVPDENSEASLRLTHGPKENNFRPSIDVLFRSAALAMGERVIGVVLTGLLDDGASGLYAIKQCGGLAIVQNPIDAQAPNMPINAMRAVEVDHVVPIAEMGALLTQLVNNSVQGGGAPVPRKNTSDHLQTEVRVALEEDDLKQDIIELGDFSPYTCPECHGSLVQIMEGNTTRFRCHTGHAFTLDTLLSAITEKCEATLWSAVRVLQESELLTEHLSNHFRELGDHEISQIYLQKKAHIMHQAKLVRQAILKDEDEVQINQSHF